MREGRCKFPHQGARLVRKEQAMFSRKDFLGLENYILGRTISTFLNNPNLKGVR
jgi:hypothetical protein